MSTIQELQSSPGIAAAGASLEEQLTYYKEQYESLESELQDFQASSKELEQELEKDIDASEKRERKLKEKVESLGFEVEEWKTKYKQAKTEANSAQNSLQKEITSLRDAQRTLQLKLRDIEVVNDDFERQARNTTSSLDDLEQKHNQSIERGVMLEEEIKIVEQDREGLRIETQRLRDELSDLKIEAEIVQEKLRQAEATIERHHDQKSHMLAAHSLRPPSPLSETSTSGTTLSSPTASTPPTKDSSALANADTPPSPPLSEVSAAAKSTGVPSTPLPARKKSIALHADATPRPGYYSSRAPRHSRGPSLPVGVSGRTTPSISRRAPPLSAPRPSMGQPDLPRSGSLYQIRGLIGKMQKLEERVHSARSKLPAPINTPPRASPRNGSALGHHIPSTVTVRSNRKRSSAAGSTASYGTGEVSGTTGSRKSVSRLSFGGSQRPPSSLEKAPPVPSDSRPSSRASVTSGQQYVRPSSRSSMSGARTPMGNYPSGLHRPRSSMSLTNEEQGDSLITPIARRTTLDKNLSSIPTPSAIPRRQSGGIPRRTSAVGVEEGAMPPPTTRSRKLSDLGESY